MVDRAAILIGLSIDNALSAAVAPSTLSSVLPSGELTTSADKHYKSENIIKDFRSSNTGWQRTRKPFAYRESAYTILCVTRPYQIHRSTLILNTLTLLVCT